MINYIPRAAVTNRIWTKYVKCKGADTAVHVVTKVSSFPIVKMADFR